MPKHEHADLMAEYAKDAATTREPWELWQFRSGSSGDWEDCSGGLRWHENHEYRRKPKTIRIGDYNVPEPLRVAPKDGSVYWMPNTTNPSLCQYYTWVDDYVDKTMLQRGFVHMTRKAAELHTKAIISLTKIK